jgi:adenylate cyclase, class 2
MYEIEAKVKINAKEESRLRKKLERSAKKKGQSTKIDTYYGTPKDLFMRIRKKGKRSILNIKSKKVEGGIECNQEVEFELASNLTHLINKMGIERTASKQKKSTVYQCKGSQVELNHVVGLGNYLEIESIAKTKKEIPSAKKKLETLFRQFGFKTHQFEKRYYLDLLQEKRRKVK